MSFLVKKRAAFKWKNAISGFPVSPGSAEVLVRWGGKIKYILIACFLGNICAKNCHNRTVYVKITASCKGGTFFWDTVDYVCRGELPHPVASLDLVRGRGTKLHGNCLILQCGPMVALPNIDCADAPCWTPQFGWRPLIECRAGTRRIWENARLGRKVNFEPGKIPLGGGKSPRKWIYSVPAREMAKHRAKFGWPPLCDVGAANACLWSPYGIGQTIIFLHLFFDSGRLLTSRRA